MPSFYAKNNFVRKWAVSKKIVTGFAQISAFGNSIYLFGSYLRFKSLYKFLGIKLYESPLNL
ncbi:hypothetical protein BU597_11720 [Staphylococcus arlettae]|nr:hypothetical protein BU605_07570 [Staphylococcus arlettae]PTH51240.1 hypothetical protein BU597_11720 [Staphylococcus arlettae]